jgi:hypothetical protein
VRLSGSSVAERRTAKLSYTLSGAAKVKLVVALATKGRTVKGMCVAAAKRSRSGKACTRYTAKGTLALSGKAGTNTTVLSTKLGRKTLAPGTYRLTLTATPASGGAQTKTLALKVTKK